MHLKNPLLPCIAPSGSITRSQCVTGARPIDIPLWHSLFRGLTAVALLLLTGCTTRLTDFTVISTKNVDFSAISRAHRGTTRVRGEDMAHIVILFPTKVPNLKEAIDRTIEKTPGAVGLVDGVVYHRTFYIPYIYGQSAYVVEGTPLILNSSRGASATPRSTQRYLSATFDPRNHSVQLQQISQTQFTQLTGRPPRS